jgi:hypothetical protein
MRLPTPIRPLFLLHVLVLFLAGCSGNRELKLNQNDLYVLNRTAEMSPWVYRKSNLELQAYGKGTVEVRIEGEVLRKQEAKDGPLWFPVALMRELPQFYKVSGGNATAGVELEAYKTENGLWCVTAMVPLSTLQSAMPQTAATASAEATATQPAPPIPLKLNVLMVSPEFTGKLPLLLPIGQASPNIAATVLLPNGSNFTSLYINSDGSPTPSQTKLTSLPASASDGAVRAVAKLAPDAGPAVNFSNVTFSNSVSISAYWNVLAIFLLAAAMWAGYWILSHRKLKIKSEIADLHLQNANALFALENRFKDDDRQISLTNARSVFTLLEGFKHTRVLELLEEKWDKIDSTLRALEETEGYAPKEFSLVYRREKWIRRGGTLAVVDILEEHKKELVYLNRELEEQISLQITGSRYFEYSKHFELRLDYLINFYRQVAYRRQRLALIGRILDSGRWVIIVLTISYFLSFLLLNAFGQGGMQQSSPPVVGSASALGNIGMEMGSDDFKADKTPMSLTFTAISNDTDTQNVILSTPGNQVSIDTASIEPDSAKVIATDKEARLTVPTSKVPPTNFLLALNDPMAKITEAELMPTFVDALRKGTKFKLALSYKNAETFNRTAWGGRINLFPFETKKVVIPFVLDQPTMWSEISIKRPADYNCTITADGIRARFEDDGQNCKVVGLRKELPLTLRSGQPVTITIELGRTGTQQAILTVGQLLVGLVAGILLGILWAKKSLKTRLASAGIEVVVIIGMLWLIRNSVYGSYTDLPKLLFSGQTPTVFELFTIAAVLLCAVTALVSHKVAKRWR